MFNSASLTAAVGALATLAGEIAVVAGVSPAQIEAAKKIAAFVTDLIDTATEAGTVLTSQDQVVVDSALQKIRSANLILEKQVADKLASE
jgi:hypothetical protein